MVHSPERGIDTRERSADADASVDRRPLERNLVADIERLPVEWRIRALSDVIDAMEEWR